MQTSKAKVYPVNEIDMLNAETEKSGTEEGVVRDMSEIQPL